MKKRKRRKASSKKIGVVLGIFVLSLTTLFGILTYYNIDPSLLASLSFYQSLANPSVRVVNIQEGLRKEEVADILAEKLDWDEDQKKDFINVHLALNSRNLEGRYFPKTYILSKNDTPLGVTATMLQEFNKEAEKIKKPKTAEVINQDTAIKIASIIQREAGGKSDMRLISGIIWNRIFKGMKLQIDATIQYAKGNEEDGWWRMVSSKDKYIDSSYNTYLYTGLPPSPIANPGLSALEAAYNPQKTDCLFYMHDKRGRIHCSATYEGHKRNIAKYY